MPSHEVLGNAYEICVAEFLRKFTQPGSTAVDGGACLGLHTSPLSQYVGLNGVVFAFEPIPNLISRLQVKYRYFKNVEIVGKALGSTPEIQKFYWEIDHPGYSSLIKRHDAPPGRTSTLEVQVVRLDDVLEKRSNPVSVIKLDLEGGEFSALEGAKGVLLKDRPMIVTEFTRALTLKKQGRTESEWEQFIETIQYQHFDLFGQKYNGDENCWYSLLVPVEKIKLLADFKIWCDGFKLGINQEFWNAFLSSP